MPQPNEVAGETTATQNTEGKSPEWIAFENLVRPVVDTPASAIKRENKEASIWQPILEDVPVW